ncbi:hypothetical protein C8Q76DRAFT_665452 [Earliella scabrosa]|nr:hypothetical protein C8Q76DRAFT_665452 [Earliella scabrosa]
MSSLYSQPLTRRSTATDESSLVHTPRDDTPLPQKPKSGSRFAAHGGAHIRSSSQATSSRSALLREQDHAQREDPGSHFAKPSRHRQEGTSELSRRGTTKALIGRFEAMGDSSASAAQQGMTASRIREPAHGEKKDKGRSPIRQSFRNLLSVFKKNKPPARDSDLGAPPLQEASRRQSLSPTPYSSRSGGNIPYEGASRRQAPPPLTLQIPEARPASNERTICISPVSAHTGKAGPLLYLSRLPSSDIPPVWMDCTAQLHSTHILVTWETPQGNPSPKLVSFTACTDVRSLSPADMNETERGLLPRETEWKVFELLFEGRARERFAAKSLTERATWVSAIWDAVLLAQENRTRSPTALSASAYTEPASPFSILEKPATIRTVSPVTKLADPAPPLQPSRISATSLDRNLPPVPVVSVRDEPPVLPRLDRNLSLTPSALSSLPAPPATPTSVRTSFLAPTRPDSPARTPSPSIRNLDQRSVVKQRLAQIERASPSRPQSPSSPASARSGGALGMRRQTTAGSSTSGTESIVDSYMGRSPVSVRSDRLTTIASRIGSPPPGAGRLSQMDPSASRWLCPPKEDTAPLSPASDYSVDEGAKAASPTRNSAFRPLPVPLPIDTVQAAEVRGVVPDLTIKPMLEDLKQGVDRLEEQSATDRTNIDCIRTTVEEVLDEVRRLPKPQEDGRAPDAVLLERLEGLRTDMKIDMQALRGQIESSREVGNGAGSTPIEVPGLEELGEKLEELLQQSRQRPTGEDAGAETEGAEGVLSLLKDAEEQRATQSEQQTDSIRYLNQLNTWLEAFVQHGTSQIDGVAAGVQQLCNELGPVPELQDGADIGEAPSGSLLTDIRKLLIQNNEREQSATQLHASMNGLVAAVQEDLRRSAEARNLLTPECVLGMIDQQRRDQAQMLKALATELSNDIRGERLRFVEAMKEATAINVQIHVEEFKKELTREVLCMTQEVTRLERERQGLEQHIADLFAFSSACTAASSRYSRTCADTRRGRPRIRPRSSTHAYGLAWRAAFVTVCLPPTAPKPRPESYASCPVNSPHIEYPQIVQVQRVVLHNHRIQRSS